MTNEQQIAVARKMDYVEGIGGVIIEDPHVMRNELFGPTVYFTAKWGEGWRAHYCEYGVKPDGEVFTVR